MKRLIRCKNCKCKRLYHAKGMCKICYTKRKNKTYRRHNRKWLNESSHKYYIENRERLKEYVRVRQKREYALARREVLDKYGCRCVRCGEDDWRCLQLDHINGGGRQEMDHFRTNQITRYRIYVKEYDKFKLIIQILCANCNWKKKYERNETARLYPQYLYNLK